MLTLTITRKTMTEPATKINLNITSFLYILINWILNETTYKHTCSIPGFPVPSLYVLPIAWHHSVYNPLQLIHKMYPQNGTCPNKSTTVWITTEIVFLLCLENTPLKSFWCHVARRRASWKNIVFYSYYIFR